MRCTRRAFLAAALAALLAPAMSTAHEGGLDARGTVVEVTGEAIVIDTEKGERRRFVVTARTEVRRGSMPAKVGDISAGERVVVHARKTPSAAEAISIRLARTAK